MNTFVPSTTTNTRAIHPKRPKGDALYFEKERQLPPYESYHDQTIETSKDVSTTGSLKKEDHRRKSLEHMRSNHGSVEQHQVRHIVDGLLSPRSLTCVVMNLISAGYILLPHGTYDTSSYQTLSHRVTFVAFAHAGVILSSSVLLLVILQTYISGNFVLVAGAYAEALNNLQGGKLPGNYSFALRNRKYEVSYLYQMFMSRAEALFFSLTTVGDLYGITWVLISIFATTLDESIPFSDEVDSYNLYLLIFVCFSLPLSCTSIIEQYWVQLVFLGLRMIMVLCMLGTIFCARMGTIFGEKGQPHFGELIGPVDDIPMFDFRGTIPLVMTCIFSTAYQFSVPNVAASAKNIKKVPKVFQTAVGFIYTTNIAVAIFISMYFGRKETLASSNLLWNNYHGGHLDDTPVWASIIARYVTLFAAIDGMAVYPMLVIALGDILMGIVYGDNVHSAEQNWKIRMSFRLLAAIPQAVGAIFISDLSFITNYAGVCTLLSYTTAPALLFLHSRKRMNAAKLPLQTYYSTRLSSPVFAMVLVVLSFAIIGAVVVDTAWRRFGVTVIRLTPDNLDD